MEGGPSSDLRIFNIFQLQNYKELNHHSSSLPTADSPGLNQSLVSNTCRFYRKCLKNQVLGISGLGLWAGKKKRKRKKEKKKSGFFFLHSINSTLNADNTKLPYLT